MTTPEPSDQHGRQPSRPSTSRSGRPLLPTSPPSAASASRAGSRSRWPRRSGATPRSGSPTVMPLVTGCSASRTRVLPQLENAVLAGHDVILLGERGQAKTRIIRSMVGLLDEWLPVVAHSEINDDPYHPDLPFRQGPAGRGGRRPARGVGPPERPLRREAGHAGHLDRRPHRRGRPHPGGRRPVPVRRADHPLRPGAPAQPGHLRRQRAPGPGRTHPGRAAQRARGARRPDPRPPGAPARSTSCWWPRPIPRTTPTGAGSSPP